MMEKFNVTCSGGVSVINLSSRPFNSNTESWEWPGAEAKCCSPDFLKCIAALHNYEQQLIHLHAWGPNMYQEHSYTQVDTLIFSVSKFLVPIVPSIDTYIMPMILKSVINS